MMAAATTAQAHERSLDTDILFGLVRRLQPKRPELKVIVMSATLDVDLFRSFFRVRERERERAGEIKREKQPKQGHLCFMG